MPGLFSATLTDKEKIPLGGVKFSEEQSLFTLQGKISKQQLLHLLTAFSDQTIPLPYYSARQDLQRAKIVFAVDLNLADTVDSLLAKKGLLALKQNRQDHLACSTFFPHRNSFSFAAQIFELFTRLALPVYAAATSISAFVVVTDCSGLGLLETEIAKSFLLPENHAPFRQEFLIKEMPRPKEVR